MALCCKYAYFKLLKHFAQAFNISYLRSNNLTGIIFTQLYCVNKCQIFYYLSHMDFHIMQKLSFSLNWNVKLEILVLFSRNEIIEFSLNYSLSQCSKKLQSFLTNKVNLWQWCINPKELSSGHYLSANRA